MEFRCTCESAQLILHEVFTCSFYISGIRLKHNVKSNLQRAGITEDPGLTDRMCKYLLASKSYNTVKKYFYSFRRWQDFCVSKNYKSLPAQHIHVAIYITELLDSQCSVQTVSAAVYSIKWAHAIKGLEDPTNNAFVRNLLESAKRLRGRKTIKKDIVSSEMIIELCDNYADSSDLASIRDLSMITLGYAGFLRFDEMSNIKCNDISFCADYVRIEITKSKTDQYRSGNEVLISKGCSSAYPYSMLERYMSLAGLNTESDDFLYKPLFRSGAVCKPIYKNKKLSYTRARECLLDKLKQVAPNLNLGIHSLRASGCTNAANENINDRCLKIHGRWKRDESKDGFIADSIDKKLEITKSLGL